MGGQYSGYFCWGQYLVLRSTPFMYFNFWLLTGRGWQNLLLSLVTAITGTLVEMTLVAAGAFSYLQPAMLGVPYWLPFMYACASLAVGDLGRSLMYRSARGT